MMAKGDEARGERYGSWQRGWAMNRRQGRFVWQIRYDII